MKHIKPYNIFEGRDEVLLRVSGRRDKAKAAIPEFITKISEVIHTNYELYDIDETGIMNTINSYLTADKGKVKIEYRDVCGTELDNTGRVISMILNFGYSIGYFSGKLSTHDVDVRFDEFINDMFNSVHFHRVSDNKLSYNGPIVLSSSITATSFDTKKQIDEMDDMIERYYDGDYDKGEISVLIGCIYQYGYGLGNDTAYMVQMEEHEALFKKLTSKE